MRPYVHSLRGPRPPGSGQEPLLVPLRRADFVVALALAGILLALGAWKLVPGVAGVYHDDAIYVITAKALAQGDGYRLVNLPGAPPQTKYPILYPLLLAGVWRLQPAFPANVVLMQYLTLLLGASGIGLAYLYLVRFGYCRRLAAGCVGLLCATSPEIAYFGTITVAEMPLLLLTLVALWRLELAMIGRPTMLQAMLTGFVIAMPLLCRSAGAALLLGSLAVLVMRRRPVAWIALGAAIPAAAWLVWSSGAWGAFETGGASGYYTDYGGNWITNARLSFVSIIGQNTLLLLASTPMSALFGSSQVLERAGPLLVPFLMMLGGGTWVAIAVDVASRRPLAWFLLAYGVVVVAWPWPPSRFLVPMYPFLAAYLWTALRPGKTLMARVASRRAMVCVAGLACTLALTANVATLAVWAAAGREAGYPVQRPPGPAFAWTSFESLFSWLRERPDRTALVAGGLDTMLHLYTGHPALRPFPHRAGALYYGAGYPPTGTAEELVAFLRSEGVRYVVETPMYLFAEEVPFASVLKEVRASHPRLLTEVYRGQDPRFGVYEVVR